MSIECFIIILFSLFEMCIIKREFLFVNINAPLGPKQCTYIIVVEVVMNLWESL